MKSLDDAIRDVMRWLDGERLPGAIIGGVAASFLGRPRLTLDVDVIVLAGDLAWERVLDSAARYGLAARIDDPLEFAANTRMLLLRHASGIDVDVMLGGLAFDEALIARAMTVDAGPLRLRVARAEDLIVMKALARRPRDLADIETILDVQRELDLDYVRARLREFSAMLDAPEVQEEFERVLRRR